MRSHDITYRPIRLHLWGIKYDCCNLIATRADDEPSGACPWWAASARPVAACAAIAGRPVRVDLIPFPTCVAVPPIARIGSGARRGGGPAAAPPAPGDHGTALVRGNKCSSRPWPS